VTDIVTIRRMTADDAELVTAWRHEPSAARYQPLHAYPVDRQRAMLARRAEMPIAPDAGGKLQWMALHDDIPAGWVSLDITSREHQTGSIGYLVGEAFRGRRIAPRALALVIPIAFDPAQLDLARLEANVAVENIASQRVLEGNGFRREGTLRGLLNIGGVRVDHYRYGLLRADLPRMDVLASE